MILFLVLLNRDMGVYRCVISWLHDTGEAYGHREIHYTLSIKM